MPRYSQRTGLLQTYQVGPYDSTHLYIQWGGKLPGGEAWSCGFRMWKAAGSVEADGAAVLVNVGAAIVAFHIRAETHLDAKAVLTFVKANAIALDGTYQGDGTNEATYADTPGAYAVSSGSSFPNQTALVASLTTGFSRGAAHRGRFFLPLPVVTLDADGAMPEAIADEIRGSLDQLRTDVNSAGAGHVMTVMSRKAGGAGHRAVTGFELGRVLDTQRRRRRSLAENYQ